MKKTIPRSLFCMFALALCFSLCLFFGRVLFTYTVPMEDASYNLSLGWEGEAMPEDWEYDQKGWSAFTQEGEQVTPLTPDGTGGFTGLQEPGQTFYLSRALTEILSSPTLRLDTANRSVAVFLDGELVYTDCPFPFVLYRKYSLLEFPHEIPNLIPAFMRTVFTQILLC